MTLYDAIMLYAIGGALWIVAGEIAGASRAAYRMSVARHGSVVEARAVTIVGLVFIFCTWPLLLAWLIYKLSSGRP